ncbi:FHA domain-containing protein [Paenibacillus durus]|uniref:FHA domain-containing protein n=1 Tax=Paenibacillus durus ATCC 35681 TaxID=1333534 RepID=A0A0F7FB94_PAEDU|nr:FHA domain-containing protein [Paenibacillus durus]AKG36030.1 hypothetical protein VK70_16895 [Paenibacillus durus ATCC 35681]
MVKSVRVIWLFILDVIIWGLIAATAIQVFRRPDFYPLKVGVVAGAACCVLLYLYLGRRRATDARGVEAVDAGKTVTNKKPRPRQAARPPVQEVIKLVLLDDDGDPLKEWYIKGEISLLIGKTNARQEADIDLADSEYASLVSAEHAVLNRVGSEWYVEDVDSRSGTGLRAAKKSSVDKLESGTPHRIGPGDLLYIANTRLLVK